MIDPLIQAINRIIQSQQAAARRGQPAPDAGAIAFRKQDGATAHLRARPAPGRHPPGDHGDVPADPRAGQGPARLRRQRPHRPISAADLTGSPPERLWKPTGAFVPMARRLPGDLIFLTVSDPRDTLPGPDREPAGPHPAAQHDCSRRCSRHAGRPAVPSAPTISSRSAWRCTTTMPLHDSLPQAGHRRQGRQAAAELASGDPALPRTAAAVR